MDTYFPVTTPSAATASRNDNASTKREERKYRPYVLSKDASKNKSEQPSSAAVSKFLLSTLADESNPITHSDSGENATYVFSTATGHQVSEGKTNRRLYLEDRTKKINVQSKEATTPEQPQVLVNVKCYINGFLANTTDLEMKRIIVAAGGKVLYVFIVLGSLSPATELDRPTASRATHILTSQHLSGSKTHRILDAKSKSHVPHVVKPEWVMDSIAAGRKRPEREYAVIKNTGTKNLYDMMVRK
ncbi:hypothetical protein B0H15DRAFT_969639 [Mycena belliarum]|uniref:BRCT domain-containing protein n=1 Tax=Mycena belliarum TaxID=1033014 RepID=A0AAD6U839_9AGAR|nr:hypothetical protein B0H15DRAFT_969639 [Mycena belliae]